MHTTQDKSTPFSVDTIQINKVALKNNDNKRLRSFNGITTCPYGTSAFMVCIEELKIKQALASYLDGLKATNHHNQFYNKNLFNNYKRCCASYTF